MRNIRTLALVLLFSLKLSAQTDTLLRYLDHDLKATTRKEDVAYEVITLVSRITEGHFLIQDYFSENGKKLRQTYLDGRDSSTAIGPYISYHRNGAVSCKGNYVEGKKTGLWRYWHDNKRLADSCIYNEKGLITGHAIRWWENGEVKDSAFYHPDSNGHAYAWSFFPDRKRSGEGPLINGSEDGIWMHYYPSGTVSARETYSNGSLLDMQCFNEDGTLYQGRCEPEIDASFPGGISKWQDYIVRAISIRAWELYKDQAAGQAVVLFAIDVKGKVRDVKIETSSGSRLDSHAMEIIRQSPEWIPAREHNRPVKAYRRQSITFKQEER